MNSNLEFRHVFINLRAFKSISTYLILPLLVHKFQHKRNHWMFLDETQQFCVMIGYECNSMVTQTPLYSEDYNLKNYKSYCLK